MSLWKRIMRYLRGQIEHKIDTWESPDILIDQLVREMKENQVKNRELAVQAITQKNNLQAEVDRQERMAAEFERKATLALQTGNREAARQLLREKATVETTLGMLRQSLAVALEAAEKVKTAIKSEEERLRQRMAEAQAWKARLYQAQVQEKMATAFGQFSLNDNQTSWDEVERRIQETESRGLAIGELHHLSMQAKLDEIEMYQKDIGIEQELEELERRLALGGSTAGTSNASEIHQGQIHGGGGVLH